MLYREIIAVCSEIHTKHINTAVWAERRICDLEVRHPCCVGSITKDIVYYTYSQTQLYLRIST